MFHSSSFCFLFCFSFPVTPYNTFYVSFLLKLRRSILLMMSSKKDREIWKDKCINLFQKKKRKGRILCRVSDNLRVNFPNLREDSQICNTCRFELTNLKGRLFLNFDNTARIPNQVQSDIDTVVDDDAADNNECDTDFSIPLKVNDTKMQCDDEYHKAGVKVLDQIIGKFNVSKSRQEKFQLLLLAPIL